MPKRKPETPEESQARVAGLREQLREWLAEERLAKQRFRQKEDLRRFDQA